MITSPIDATSILIAFIVAVPPTILAFASLLATRNTRKATQENKAKIEETKKEVISTKDGIFELGKQVDGRLTELLVETAKAATLAGIAAGIAKERANPQVSGSGPVSE